MANSRWPPFWVNKMLNYGFGIYFDSTKQTEEAKKREEALTDNQKEFYNKMLGLVLECTNVQVISKETLPIIVARLDFLYENDRGVTQEPLTIEQLTPFIGVHSNVSPEGTEHWVWKHSDPRINKPLNVTEEKLMEMQRAHLRNDFK